MNRLARLAVFLVLPLTLVHELCHYVAGVPFADDAALFVREGRATTFLEYSDDVSRWAVALACLCPTIVGTVVGVVAVAWWLSVGFAMPADLSSWMRLAIAALSWGVFTTPSAADVRRALGGAST
jgi:hypothetical protein